VNDSYIIFSKVFLTTGGHFKTVIQPHFYAPVEALGGGGRELAADTCKFRGN
jgi:hypothetical protein